MTEELIGQIQKEGAIYVNGARTQDIYYGRFTPNGTTEARDVDYSWKIISETAAVIICS